MVGPSELARTEQATDLRARVLRRLASNAVSLLAAWALAMLIAVVWLAIRTGGGARDVWTVEAMLAVSFACAAMPAWTAARVYAIARTGISDRSGDPVAAWRRALWIALHPLTLPAWAWLTAVLAIATLPAAYVALAASVVVAVLSVASLLVLLTVPASRALHTRLARDLGARA
jgi:hypothetical protein